MLEGGNRWTLRGASFNMVWCTVDYSTWSPSSQARRARTARNSRRALWVHPVVDALATSQAGRIGSSAPGLGAALPARAGLLCLASGCVVD